MAKAWSSEQIRKMLTEHIRSIGIADLPKLNLHGQLLRPLVAYAAAPDHDARHGPAFVNGVLGLQMAHEASLLHDDIVDQAPMRRGRPTAVTRHGLTRTLIEGNRLLTSSYRIVAQTHNSALMDLFTQAVDQTVVGEQAQGQLRGEFLSWKHYLSLVRSKTGGLFGLAMALYPALAADPDCPRHTAVGRHLGALYQMVDDLLDYCPHATTGKEPFSDYRNSTWTWPLTHLRANGFRESADLVTPVSFVVGKVRKKAAFAELSRKSTASSAMYAASCSTSCLNPRTSWIFSMAGGPVP